MFERFTEEARQVVTVALEEARLMRHDHVGTEHLLVALAGEPAIAPLLAGYGLTREQARAEVVRTVGLGEHVEGGYLPFTPAAKDALEATLQEAIQVGRDRVEPAHVLLGILRQRDGLARRMLLTAGAAPREFRETVIRGLLGEPRAPAADADAQILLAILDRGGPAAAFLRERGVDEAAVRALARGER